MCSVEDEGRGAGSIETTRATQRARHVCSAAPQMHCALHCLGWKLNFALSITLLMHPRFNSANIVCIVHVLHLGGMPKKLFTALLLKIHSFCIMHLVLSSVISVTPFWKQYTGKSLCQVPTERHGEFKLYGATSTRACGYGLADMLHQNSDEINIEQCSMLKLHQSKGSEIQHKPRRQYRVVS